jgi:hypothetical protein
VFSFCFPPCSVDVVATTMVFVFFPCLGFMSSKSWFFVFVLCLYIGPFFAIFALNHSHHYIR